MMWTSKALQRKCPLCSASRTSRSRPCLGTGRAGRKGFINKILTKYG